MIVFIYRSGTENVFVLFIIEPLETVPRNVVDEGGWKRGSIFHTVRDKI